MRYIDEYRDPTLVHALAGQIHRRSSRPVVLMEVCGSHTMAIQRFGIRSLLPDTVTLISGPGCPVCVTEVGFVDMACAIARRRDTTVATFGDLLRVPGSESSLENERASGADIRVVQSSLEAVALARENPDRKILFLGIGFETTAPTTAAAVCVAERRELTNFFILSAHKLMKPAMIALVSDEVRLDGYICPGHVSVVTGAEIYREIVEICSLGCVVAGFEPVDILYAIARLVEQVEEENPAVEIAYRRVVTWKGSRKARAAMEQVFEPRDTLWRGLGEIAGSGLAVRRYYRRFDGEKEFAAEIAGLPEPREPLGCRCGEVLKGLCTPPECPLFGRSCTPETPTGACMVSSEGTCAAYYRYRP